MAHLLGDAAEHDALQRAVAVGAHRDEVAAERLGLLDDVVGGLAATDHGAHGKALVCDARRHPVEHRTSVFDLVSHRVAGVKVGDAQQNDLAVKGERELAHVFQHREIDRRAVEGKQDAPVESHLRALSERRSGRAGTRSAR